MEENTTNSQSFTKEKKLLFQLVSALLVVLSVFVVVLILNASKKFSLIGTETPAHRTISVEGTGETVAIPDIAILLLSVVREGEVVPQTQEEVAEKMNSIIAYLEGEGIEEKDIKTTHYSIRPLYVYEQTESCLRYPCPRERTLSGYEVTQTIRVKIRETADAGKILSGVGELGATDVSGPNFTFDDEEALRAEARDLAIEDAKEKAERLAEKLDVSLVGVVNFSESGRFPVPLYGRADYGLSTAAEEGKAIPDIPAGENTITSNVTITYEIR